MGAILATSAAGVAACAPKSNTPPEVLGTYTYHDRGYVVTVGYMCPGYTFQWGTDPYANYYALVKGSKVSMSITRHAAWKLDLSMQEYFGLTLSPQAYQVLANDAATIACS